ncbi:efflux RND transporter permease subunit [Kineosporia babensis]|nr:efflux RND transporter permease subunit [Kineosporia babensis]
MASIENVIPVWKVLENLAVIRLTQISLRNRAVIALLTLLVTVGGVISALSLKQELLPSFSAPQMSVLTTVPGASPEILDEEVAVPLSAALGRVDGVTGVTAVSSTSVSSIAISTDYGLDEAELTTDLEAAIESVRAGLPSGAEPELSAGSLDDMPVISLTVSSPDAPDVLSAKLADSVVPDLEAVEGTREVTISGGQSQELLISPDPAKLARAGLTSADITTALQSNGSPLPAGSVSSDGEQLAVTAGSVLSSVKQIENLPLIGANGTATLGDVATVEVQDAEATSITRTNGEKALSIGITATSDADVVALSDAVTELLPGLEADLGEGAAITVASDQGPYIAESIEHLAVEGGLGLLFAVVVILVFLFSARSTLVTAISIPMSILVTFVGLYLWGYSLNILTLGALTIAIGRVVDDSIVVIENIKRHLELGEDKLAAILGAVREVAAAVTASTLTTVLVFLPIALVGGMVGELFRPFSLTVTIAMLSSLLVSLTIVPVLAYWFLKVPQGPARPVSEEEPNRLQKAYLPLLKATLRRPLVVLLASIVLLGASLSLLPRLSVEFIGSTGENSVTATQSFDSSLSLEQVTEQVALTEKAVRAAEGVQDVLVTASLAGASGATGGGMPGPPGSGTSGDTTANFTITTDESEDVGTVQDAIQQQVDTLPAADEISLGADGGGLGSSTVDVVITANDEQSLDTAAALLIEALTDVPDTTDITNDRSADQPSVEVVVDRQAAAGHGLSEQAVTGMVAAAISPGAAGSVTIEGTQLAIYVDAGQDVSNLHRLETMQLMPGVALNDIAEVREVTTPASVSREDGSLVATVALTPAEGKLGDVQNAAQDRIDGVDLPDGVQVELGGASEQQSEAFSSLGLAMLIAVGLIFVLLVAILRSLLQPLILMVSIPFAAIGAIVLLFVTGTPLGVAALIGMLMLIGIVVTNAIVLMDLINQYRDRGMSVAQAVEEGAGRRVRPIVMTALATIFALLPMALGVTGGSGFISQALAVVVIGGLFSSTALTLLLVPALYELVERRRERKDDLPVVPEKEPVTV